MLDYFVFFFFRGCSFFCCLPSPPTLCIGSMYVCRQHCHCHWHSSDCIVTASALTGAAYLLGGLHFCCITAIRCFFSAVALNPPPPLAVVPSLCLSLCVFRSLCFSLLFAKHFVQSLSRAVTRISKDLLVVTLGQPDKPATPPAARAGSGMTKETMLAELEAWHASSGLDGVLTPDCHDPDPPISRALVDARHTFLEMCQVSSAWHHGCC